MTTEEKTIPPKKREPLYEPPKVGGDILAFCTRCKQELAHVVVSILDGRPAKVICKTCHGQHLFRRESVRKPVRASAARGARVTVKVADFWKQRIESAKGATKNYQTTEQYKKDELVNHSKFGLGIVEETLFNKIRVLFSDSERVLVHTPK